MPAWTTVISSPSPSAPSCRRPPMTTWWRAGRSWASAASRPPSRCSRTRQRFRRVQGSGGKRMGGEEKGGGASGAEMIIKSRHTLFAIRRASLRLHRDAGLFGELAPFADVALDERPQLLRGGGGGVDALRL